jgi:predicted GNAT family acetyltransferase
MDGSDSGISRETIGDLVVHGRAWPIVVDPVAGRFESRIGEDLAFITFQVHATALSLIHTEVPEAMEGRGVAGSLVRAALDYARAHRLLVRPYCPYVAGYIGRHPEYQDVIDPAFRTTSGPGAQTH